MSKKNDGLKIAADVIDYMSLGASAYFAGRSVLDRLWATLDLAQAEDRDLTDEELDEMRGAALREIGPLGAAVR